MSKGSIIQFSNCSILRNHGIVVDDLWVRDGKILDPQKLFFDEKVVADIKIDCQGLTLAPGFIDVQINGALGSDFSCPSPTYNEELSTVARHLLFHGVTAFCPTVISSTRDVYAEVLPKLKSLPGGPHGACILGAHLEGPFISVERRGAHVGENIVPIVDGMKDVMNMYQSLDNVRIITLAPEQPNALPVINELTKKGIVVSLGHSDSDLSQGEEAVYQGASFITHLFNAMLPFHHRDPHLVGLLASRKIGDKPLFYGMIADGIHTHPAAIRIAHRTHPDGLVLVTDAMNAMGLTSGIHHLGTQKVEIRQGQALVAGTNTLCGSIATMNECVMNLYHLTECSKVQALEAASLHPAQLLGTADPGLKKGRLDPGYDADLVMVDDDLNVKVTVIAGEIVWRSQDCRVNMTQALDLLK